MTKRANSALPPGDAGRQESGLPAMADFYRQRGLPAIVQVPDGPGFERLDSELARRGYLPADPTLVLRRPVPTSRAGRRRGPRPEAMRPGPGTQVTVSDAPAPAWFRTWWSVDGRGGDDAARTASRILSATRSRYLSVVTDGVTVGVARLTPTPGFGALACVAVAAEARQRGVGRLLLDTALAEAARLGLGSLQLQVIAANPAAAWYQRAGFSRLSGYHYRVQPAAA
ncbi:GNAT family N-acetyltransferase [Glaciibacter sp. 2TAF33]